MKIVGCGICEREIGRVEVCAKFGELLGKVFSLVGGFSKYYSITQILFLYHPVPNHTKVTLSPTCHSLLTSLTL